MTPVIFDCGSFSIKAGSCEDEVPQIIRSIVGRSRSTRQRGSSITSVKKPSTDPSDATYCGDSALGLGNNVCLSEPISESMIESFEDFELLMDFVYQAIGKTSEDHPVVFAEPSFNSAPRREKISEIFFEHFNVPELNITMQGILALVGTGRVTGLVLDCGHGGCNTVPIFESFVIPNGIESVRIGGRDLDILLARYLSLRDVRLAKSVDKETLRDLKEKLCYCQKSIDDDIGEGPIECQLPDGQRVSLGNERFAVPEAYFAPSLVGAEGEGVAALVARSIKKSPIDLTKPLVSNIILSGASSMFNGFSNRLASEVKSRVSSNMAREVKVIASQDRAISVWNGGKAFAELRENFEERWMTKDEYAEYGAEYIHNKVMSHRMTR
jgi:actin-related protein